MRKNMPYMVLDITKKPGDPNAVKTGDMLLAENEGLHKALSDIAENLRIHLQLPTQTISMNRREVECMINDCEKALGKEVASLRSFSRERGDCAKLREALKLVMDEMCNRCRDLAAARGNPLPCLSGCEPVRRAKAALAAPPRNCDVGDAADWEKRFGEECDKAHICSDCPVRDVKTRMAIELDKGARCEFVWAQMPSEEGGAK